MGLFSAQDSLRRCPKDPQLSGKRVEYLNNVLVAIIAHHLHLLRTPLFERPAEVQVLGLFDMMKAPDERSQVTMMVDTYLRGQFAISKAPMQTPWMLASSLYCSSQTCTSLPILWERRKEVFSPSARLTPIFSLSFLIRACDSSRFPSGRHRCLQ